MFHYGDSFWNSSVGEVVTISSAQAFFVDTLGFTLDEYNSLSSCLMENSAAFFDFIHMQAALVGRLAYSLGIGLAGLNEEVSFLCGWLGDATILGSNLTTAIPNGDYCADLDAENIYRLIINNNYSSVQATSIYYQSLTNQTRATVFLTYISFNYVKAKIFSALVDSELFELYYSALRQEDNDNAQVLFNLIYDEPYHWTVIRSRYPDTYDFLMSLNDELSLIAHYQ